MRINGLESAPGQHNGADAFWMRGTTLSDLSSPPFISRQPPRATLPPRALPHPSCGLVMYIYLTTGSIMPFLWCSTYAGINTRYLCTYMYRHLEITTRNIAWIAENYTYRYLYFFKLRQKRYLLSISLLFIFISFNNFLTQTFQITKLYINMQYYHRKIKSASLKINYCFWLYCIMFFTF